MKSFLLGAKTEVKSLPTARDYVQDGLIAMWDGIENVGWGLHDEHSLDWYDLIGGRILQTSENTFDAIGLNFSGSGGIVPSPDIRLFGSDATDGHLEVVLTKTGDSAADIPIAGAWNSGLFVMSDYSGRQKYLQFANNNYGRVPVDSVKDVHSMSCAYNGTSYPPHMYANAIEVFKDGSANGWSNSGVLRVGSGATKSYYPFHGSIHSIRVYSRELTPAEVAANYAIDQRRFSL